MDLNYSAEETAFRDQVRGVAVREPAPPSCATRW